MTIYKSVSNKLYYRLNSFKRKKESYMISTLEHWDIESKEGLCEYIICTYNIKILTA